MGGVDKAVETGVDSLRRVRVTLREIRARSEASLENSRGAGGRRRILVLSENGVSRMECTPGVRQVIGDSPQ